LLPPLLFNGPASDFCIIGRNKAAWMNRAVSINRFSFFLWSAGAS